MSRIVQIQVRVSEEQRRAIHRASAEEQIRRGESYTMADLARDAIREWIERRSAATEAR
jgi:hypothetical protein